MIWEQFAIRIRSGEERENSLPSHVNQLKWHFYRLLEKQPSLFLQPFFPLLSKMATENTKPECWSAAFFWLIVNWIGIHYPLCVKWPPLSRFFISSICLTPFACVLSAGNHCCSVTCCVCLWKWIIVTHAAITVILSVTADYEYLALCFSVWVGAGRGVYRQHGLCCRRRKSSCLYTNYLWCVSRLWLGRQ